MITDRGSAVVELVAVCVLLVTPIVAGVTALHRLHAARTALEAGTAVIAVGVARGDVARHDAHRVMASLPDPAIPAGFSVRVHCRPGPCGGRGGLVEVRTRGDVSTGLPFVPAVTLRTRHVEPVDRYGWSTE